MMKTWLPCFPALAVMLTFAPCARAQNNVVITEFLAVNTGGLLDENGDASDWIEVQNPGPGSACLDDWFLTDDRTTLMKWRFPATNLSANAYLLVFASGKNRATAGASLHTSFALGAAGGYLALVRPDGVTIASEFSYGPQFAGVSFGAGLGPTRNTESLVGAHAPLRFLIPSAPVAQAWRGGAAFDDSLWSNGSFAAGFDQTPRPTNTAYAVSAGTAGNQAYGGALGMDFDVTLPVEVTELGCFDDTGNGIGAGITITVALWRRNNAGTPDVPTDDTGAGLLVRTNFTTAAPGTLIGGQRFKKLAVPVTLTSGSYTIVAYGYGAAERLGNNLGVVSVNSGSGALAFVGRSRFGDNTTVFPGTADAAVAQYAAGTFKFQAQPPNFGADLAGMRNVNASALLRVPFTVVAGADYSALTLDISFDDGFVAFLNGVEMARRNALASLAFDSAATSPASVSASLDVSAFLGQLQAGANVLAIHGLNVSANVLAIHGLNVSANDADFVIDATLAGERSASNAVYFTTPTPGAANNTGLLFPRVVINEIHSDPVNAKSRPLEFIELYNPLPTAVDVSGWSFTRGLSFTFPPGTSMAPRGYLVVAENPSSLAASLGAAALGPWTGSLANDGETIELVDTNSSVMDSVNYGLGFPWPTVGDNDYSMQLIHEGLENDLGGAWRSAPPTPGARNSVTAGNAPPLIRQVDHSPNQPAGGEVVTITAKVTGPDGVAGVSLDYQVVLPGNFITLTNAAFATNWTSLAMRDDGAGGDATAFDEVFTAQISSSVQQHRRLIRYRVNATDGANLSVRVPYADDPSPNFAYFVYDGVPAWTGAVQPGVTPTQTFDTNTMRKVQAFHLLSRSNDVWNCQYNSAFNDGVYRFEGAMVVDGKVYDHVHYRVKGQNSTYNTGKNKWKFKFNRGHWLELPDDYGQTRTTIEVMNVSSLPSSWAPWNRGMAGLDEVMQYRLSNLAGVPSPRTTYFQLRVIDDALEQPANTQFDGDFWGLYLGFENLDNRFKDAHGLPDGNIFRMQVTGAGNHLLGQGAGQPVDLSDLRAFTSTTTGYNFSPNQPEAWWRTNVDLQKYFSWRVVNEAVNNTDIRDQENVVYFRDPLTGLWHIEPWDCDLLYEQFDRWGPEATQSTAPYEQIRRCLLVTNISVEFKNRARELQDLLLNSDQAWKLVDEYVSLITDGGPTLPGFVEADRRRWDYNPINPAPPRGVGPFGNYYKTPYPVPNMGLGPPQPFFRTLASPDFAGMVTWVKNFIALDPHGGARLANLANDSTIPLTPIVTYLGAPEFPSDGLVFQTTSFSSPMNRTFAAMQWRLAEVYEPGVPNFVAGTPWRYEIEEVWNSSDRTSFDSQLTVPPEFVREGRTYRVRVKFKDSGGRWSHWSDAVQFTAGTPGVARLAQSLIVSELMYNPPALGAVSGDSFEFIELKNVGTSELNLGGLTFSSGINFAFTNGTTLASGATFLLVRDAANFAGKYPDVILNGIYSGRFDNGGETITLSHPVGGPVLSFTYDDAVPWPVAPDNFDFSLVPVNPNAPFDHSNPFNWRASSSAGGSPGGADSPSTVPPVRINEVLSHSETGVDFIELFNPTTVVADINGWFLTDDPSVPKKFRIPNNMTIGPMSYVVFTETDFNALPGVANNFSLNARGDDVYLFSGDMNTNLTGYTHGFAFGAQADGVTFGRYVVSTGEEQFPAQLSATPAAPNTGPRIGPVVITEIHYHPIAGGDEFVELKNITPTNVPLFDVSHETNTWRLNGLDYTFPTNVTLDAGKHLLLVPVSPTIFRARYSVPATVQILGPYAGQLQDSGERLELQRPDVPDTNGPAYITVEEVRYNDRSPWPVAADGAGASLQRKNAAAYGNDPANWEAALPTFGADLIGGQSPLILTQPQSGSVLVGQTANFAVSASGPPPLNYQWGMNGEGIPGATSPTLTLPNVRLTQAGNYSVIVFNNGGSTPSAIAHLTVSQPLIILLQPTNQLVRPGSPASFRVVAVGNGPLRYQWRKDGVELAGTGSSSLSISNAQLNDSGAYTCVVTDNIGPATSAPAQLFILINPAIVQSPLSQSVVVGAPVTLSVTVTGNPLPITYEWRRGSTVVSSNVINSLMNFYSFTAPGVVTSQQYRVIVKNLAYTGINTNVLITVTTLADADGDGIPDIYEAAYGAGGQFAPLADDDGDGVMNSAEYIAGTDPTNALSFLKIDSVTANGGAVVAFGTVSNRTYTIQFSDTLGGGAWSRLADVPARTTNRVEQVQDVSSTTDRFYRLVTPRQQ